MALTCEWTSILMNFDEFWSNLVKKGSTGVFDTIGSFWPMSQWILVLEMTHHVMFITFVSRIPFLSKSATMTTKVHFLGVFALLALFDINLMKGHLQG